MLYQYGQRYYQRSTGRWTQQDNLEHLGDPTQGNRYTYVGADPINHTDMSGRNWECNGAFIVAEVAIGIVLGVGGLIGLGLVAALVLGTAFTITLGIVNNLTC